jgi:ubiquinone biosynthesis protein COQ4
MFIIDLVKAAKKLFVDNPKDTRQFFIIAKLNLPSCRRGYHRLLKTKEGGRIAYNRLELVDVLMKALNEVDYSENTVGYAYKRFMQSGRFSAKKLEEISRTEIISLNDKHPYSWMYRYERDVHDIWHVLTGYDQNTMGEACLFFFSYAQLKGLGYLYLMFIALLNAIKIRQFYVIPMFFEAYKIGRSCKWLYLENYELLLNEDLKKARERLNITTPNLYNRDKFKYFPYMRNKVRAK